MEKVKKLFGGIDLNWKKLIVFAITGSTVNSTKDKIEN